MERCVAVGSTNDQAKVRSHLPIPIDLFSSILSKLPVKSLKRFGCVHKSWSLLFDDLDFMTMYRNNLLTMDHAYYDDTSIFLHQKFDSFDCYQYEGKFELHYLSGERFKNRVKLDWPSVKLDPTNRLKTEYDSGFDILGSGSVRGILCLSCVRNENIILWNPSTEEFKLIPPGPYDCAPDTTVFVEHHRFGYDHVQDDYKVLRYGLICPHNVHMTFWPHIWEIYSLRSNRWKTLEVNKDHRPIGIEQVYMDGFSHCNGKGATLNDIYMLSFDWSNEIFLTTPIPLDIGHDFDDYHLVLLNGSIALILNYTETDTFHISILGELGVKESWTKIFIVGALPRFDTFIGAGKNGAMLLRKKDGWLVFFDLNTQMIEEVDVRTIRRCCKIIIHKENLLPFVGANI